MTAAETFVHGPALWVLAFTLGIRHGLDADHLAMIDGLTRYNAKSRPAIARWCGVLFAVGHGGILIVLAVLAGSAVAHPRRDVLMHTAPSPAYRQDAHAQSHDLAR